MKIDIIKGPWLCKEETTGKMKLAAVILCKSAGIKMAGGYSEHLTDDYPYFGVVEGKFYRISPSTTEAGHFYKATHIHYNTAIEELRKIISNPINKEV